MTLGYLPMPAVGQVWRGNDARIGNLALANPPRHVLEMGQRKGEAWEAFKVRVAGLVEQRRFLRMEECV